MANTQHVSSLLVTRRSVKPI